MQADMKVLWLASWYPDEYEPTNGDFVQRHAKAVSLLMLVDVIHVVQAGNNFNSLNKVVLNDDENLHEAIYYYQYKKTGLSWLDKFLYNSAYIKFYKKIVQQYIAEKGKPDLLHVNVPMKAGIIALYILKKFKIPFIVSEHSSFYLNTVKNNFETRSFYFRHYTQKIFKKANAVTNVSAAIAVVLKEMFGLKEVAVIPNVVDTSLFFFKLKQKNKRFRWLHISAMQPLKNVDKIIRAFSNISATQNDWELVICGPINKEYEQLVHALNLQLNITFTGALSYEDVARQMQQADAFVLFSRHENFPCVVVEALCCGLPVVSSNVGGVSEAVNETNGILVEPNNTAVLQDAITQMMNDISTYNSTAIALEATSKYSYKTIAKQFIKLYQQVLKIQQ